MKVVQKISALFLAVLILLFSFGFTINKMICLKSGITEVSLGNIKDCCEAEDPTPSTDVKDNCCDLNSTAYSLKEVHCCDLSSTAFYLSDYSPSEQHSIPGAIDYMLPVSFLTTANKAVENKKLVLVYSDLPPPLYGKNLLSFISVFNI